MPASGARGCHSGGCGGGRLDSLTSRRALECLRTYKPDVYIPAHHDADRNGMWRPLEPIFQALKEEDPKLITISKQYREPICFDTENEVQRGKRRLRQ